MNEYSIVVDFQNGNIYTDLSILVQNDYNAYKLNFEFDKEFERALFKLKYPVENKEWVQDIVDNKLILPVLKDTGDYEYEISIYSEDGRLTGYATEKFHVRSELINTDEIVEPDDRVPVLDNLINETTQLKNETVILKEEVEEAIEETNNLGINISKDGKIATVELTKKDSTTKTVTLKDGTSLMFNWDGTRLGIKTDEDEEYTYVDLRGIQGPRGPQGEAFKIKKTYATIAEMIADYDNMQINDYVNIKASVEQEDNSKLFTKGETEDPVYRWLYLGDFSGATGIQGPTGATPNIQIGIVTSGTTPSVTRTGTNENPILNFVLEKGEIGPTGPQGETGNGIASITKTSTQDTVDTYTILYTNGTTSTFTVTNGEVSQKQLNVVQMELDKYKTLSKLLPKVEGEGSSVTLNNTVGGVTMDITPEGATSQYTTSGKNLFQIKTPDYVGQSAWGNYGGSTYTKLENGYYFPGRYTAIGFQYDNLDVGEDYTISFDVVSNASASIQVGLNVYQNHTEQNYWKNYTVTTTVQRITWTFTADVTNRIAFNTGSTADRNFTITNIQLEKSSTVTDYEEYTGGQPSPSPSYPQPIKVVTGNNSIVIQNQDNTQQQTYPINLNGNLLIKSTLVNGKALNNEDGKTYYNAASFSVSDYIKIEQNTTYNISNASNNTATRVFYYDNNYNFLSTERPVTSINSSTATYIRLQDNTTTFNDGYLIVKSGTTPIELAKIGDYQDYIYGSPNNWYKHEIIKKAVIINNTIINKITSTRYNIKDDIDYYFSGDNSQPGAISNYYISRYSNANGSILSSSTYNAISVYDDRFESVNDFRTWAIQNLIIYRILSTAREIQITDTTLIEQLNNLYNATSQEGTTYIICSSASDDNETLQVKASTYKDISSILNPVVESEGE